MRTTERLQQHVIDRGICVGCGACIIDASPGSHMTSNPRGELVPRFISGGADIDHKYWTACPGKGVDYPSLYLRHHGRLASDWTVGVADRAWIGYATDESVRRTGASGGVLTAVLLFLLRTKRIHAAILARQDHPSPGTASWFIARTSEDVIRCAQSVYTPVSMLDALREILPDEIYAMTCVPEQSAALRSLQQAGHKRAQQVAYILGPYTGTALRPTALQSLLRANGVPAKDGVQSLRWRAGEWPGYLEIRTNSGVVIRSRKVYYNYLTPFHITQASLQSMDFMNEFADLSVGDAWSPKFEAIGQGFSVVLSRNARMSRILTEMDQRELLSLTTMETSSASAMHGHMIDFKKRGSYIRNQWRRLLGYRAPDYGLAPAAIPLSRMFTEVVISGVFMVCGSRAARMLMERIPEVWLGRTFNRLRLVWKSFSKPIKRQGLAGLQMRVRRPRWDRLT